MISDEWVKRQLPFIRKNIKIDNTKQVVYHISLDPSIKEFKPMISHSAANSEDRTVPRVNVGVTVSDTMYGVAAINYSHVHGQIEMHNSKSNEDPVYTIYSKEVNGVVIPSDKLVYDATYTNERWLVADSPETSSYKFARAGEFFVVSSIEANGVEYEVNKTVIFLQVSRGQVVSLEKDIRLKTGFYRCTVMSNFKNRDREYFKVTKLDRKEYNEVRIKALAKFEELKK